MREEVITEYTYLRIKFQRTVTGLGSQSKVKQLFKEKHNT